MTEMTTETWSGFVTYALVCLSIISIGIVIFLWFIRKKSIERKHEFKEARPIGIDDASLKLQTQWDAKKIAHDEAQRIHLEEDRKSNLVKGGVQAIIAIAILAGVGMLMIGFIRAESQNTISRSVENTTDSDVADLRNQVEDLKGSFGNLNKRLTTTTEQLNASLSHVSSNMVAMQRQTERSLDRVNTNISMLQSNIEGLMHPKPVTIDPHLADVQSKVSDMQVMLADVDSRTRKLESMSNETHEGIVALSLNQRDIHSRFDAISKIIPPPTPITLTSPVQEVKEYEVLGVKVWRRAGPPSVSASVIQSEETQLHITTGSTIVPVTYSAPVEGRRVVITAVFQTSLDPKLAAQQGGVILQSFTQEKYGDLRGFRNPGDEGEQRRLNDIFRNYIRDKYRDCVSSYVGAKFEIR